MFNLFKEEPRNIDLNLSREILAIQETNAALVGNLEINNLLNLIIRKLINIVEVSDASIWLWDKKIECLSLADIKSSRAALGYLRLLMGKSLDKIKLYQSD